MVEIPLILTNYDPASTSALKFPAYGTRFPVWKIRRRQIPAVRTAIRTDLMAQAAVAMINNCNSSIGEGGGVS